MRSRRIGALTTMPLVVGLAAVLAACGSNNPSSTANTNGPTASSAAGAATTDPCQLVTQQEASTLAGAAFGPGKAGTSATGQRCIYGAGTKNVFMVVLWHGDAAFIQKAHDEVTQEIEQTGSTAQIQPIPVPGLGDQATAYHVSGDDTDDSSIFVLKGGYAFYLVDTVAGGHAPTTDALVAQSRTVLSRLP